ncbi:ribonuclease H-like domain-containing protein [Tanacetum coccineum]
MCRRDSRHVGWLSMAKNDPDFVTGKAYCSLRSFSVWGRSYGIVCSVLPQADMTLVSFLQRFCTGSRGCLCVGAGDPLGYAHSIGMTLLLRVSTEDANQKFLRSLPSAWSQVSLIYEEPAGVDSLSFDDSIVGPGHSEEEEDYYALRADDQLRLRHRVFKNREFYLNSVGQKGIQEGSYSNAETPQQNGGWEYSNARTPQQNRVAERKNRTLIEAARTMLADSFLPNTFWAKAVSNACYVLNRVLVTKPHNKTPYELITGKIPIISYIRPFGCHVTILNTIDHLGKFAGKSDEGFLVGYSLQSKAFRVYNLETKRVEENLHITFLENKPNVAGKGPTWLFDLDYLTDSMNYQPVRSENQANKHAGPQEANPNAGTKDIIDVGDSEKEDESAQDCFVLPIWYSYSSTIKRSRAEDADATPHKHSDLKTDEKPVDQEDQVFLDELERLKRQEKDANNAAEALRKEFAQETENLLIQAGAAKASSSNSPTPVSTASPYDGLSLSDPTNPKQDDSEIPVLEDIYQNPTDGIFTNSSYDDEGAVADFTNLETVVNVSLIPTSRLTLFILQLLFLEIQTQ